MAPLSPITSVAHLTVSLAQFHQVDNFGIHWSTLLLIIPLPPIPASILLDCRILLLLLPLLSLSYPKRSNLELNLNEDFIIQRIDRHH
jgi:hypothetical protein